MDIPDKHKNTAKALISTLKKGPKNVDLESEAQNGENVEEGEETKSADSEEPQHENLTVEDEDSKRKKLLNHQWEDWLDDITIDIGGLQVVIINDA